jgi:hypothetical protein
MPERAHIHTQKRFTRSTGTANNSATLTVASLGLQVRLSPVNLDRERQIADLIASCATLRADLERLFQQVVEFLDAEVQPARSSEFLPSREQRLR